MWQDYFFATFLHEVSSVTELLYGNVCIATYQVLQGVLPRQYTAHLSYQKSLKKLDWRVISKKNLLLRLTGASMRAICCVMSSTFHLKALITDK